MGAQSKGDSGLNGAGPLKKAVTDIFNIVIVLTFTRYIVASYLLSLTYDL